MKKNKTNTLPGNVAFKLYDTFGFPIDLTEVILKEKNLLLDMTGYQEAMEKQKQNSRNNSQFKTLALDTKVFYDLKQRFGATKFLGYDKLEASAKVLDVINSDKYKIIITDVTPFYAESGGQMGDQGTITGFDKKVFKVFDVQAPIEGLFVHFVDADCTIKKDSSVELVVDNNLRAQTAKNHSATHLLQAALVKTLGNHVKQSGSSVTFDRLRFDFTHTESVKKNELENVEMLVNQAITKGLAVGCNQMSKDDAIKKGATALFGEKYGDTVRVVNMGEVSTELCGGTHVSNTKDIQLFTILSESSLSSGVRRIEATTAEHALKHLKDRSKVLSELEVLMSSSDKQLKTKIMSLTEDLKAKNKELELIKQKSQAQNAGSLFTNSKKIKNFSLFDCQLPDDDSDLRTVADVFVQSKPDDVLFLYKTEGEKMSFILRTNRKNNLNLTLCAKTLSSLGARAGGKPDVIQGSFDANSLAAIKSAVENFMAEQA